MEWKNMPIDDVALKAKIDALNEKMRLKTEELRKFERVFNSLNMTITSEFIDDRTGKKISVTARQKIYDDNMAEADILLT